MAGTSEASMVESEGSRDSETGNKRIRSGVEEEKEDRISVLPDSLIHRILSLLPATDLVKTCVLSKSWKYQWTHVPVLQFDPDSEILVIDFKDIPLWYLDPRLSLWIRFAVGKDVKELILDCNVANVELGHEYPFPQFLFNNSSLVKMRICACDFTPNGKVNWESLKSLHLDHSLMSDQVIEHILSGSPLLEYLELRYCSFEGAIVVASEHLKTFVLKEFYKNRHLVEISCPHLERLRIWRNLCAAPLRLINLPCSLHATLDFYIFESDNISRGVCINLVEESVNPIWDVEKLEIELTRLRS